MPDKLRRFRVKSSSQHRRLRVESLEVRRLLTATLKDTFEDLAPGLPVLSRQIGDVTVTIATDNGAPMTARNYDSTAFRAFGRSNISNSPAVRSNVSGATFISSVVAGAGGHDLKQATPITFSFSRPVRDFGFTTLDILQKDSEEDKYVQLTAYDKDGNELDTHKRTALGPKEDPDDPDDPDDADSDTVDGVDLDWVVSSDTANIAYAKFDTDLETLTGYGIDDLVLSTGTVDGFEDGIDVTNRLIDGISVIITPNTSIKPDIQMTARTYGGGEPAFYTGSGPALVNTPAEPTNVSGQMFISTVIEDEHDFTQAIPIAFDFSHPVRGFGFTTLDLLENGTPAGSVISVTAYNVRGEVVDSMSRTAPVAFEPDGNDLDWTVSSDEPEILRVVLSGGLSTLGGYGIDDLSIDSPVIVGLAWDVAVPMEYELIGTSTTLKGSGTTPAHSVSSADRQALRNALESMYGTAGVSNIVFMDGVQHGENLYFVGGLHPQWSGDAFTKVDQFNSKRSGGAAIFWSSDVERNSQVAAHELGHLLGLRHINPPPEDDPLNIEIMDYDYQGAYLEQFINVVSQALEADESGKLTVSTGKFHNPVYHLERYVDMHSVDELLDREIDSGSWDLVPGEPGSSQLARVRLSFGDSNLPLYNVQLVAGNDGSEGTFTELAAFEVLSLADLSSREWNIELGTILRLFATDSPDVSFPNIFLTSESDAAHPDGGLLVSLGNVPVSLTHVVGGGPVDIVDGVSRICLDDTVCNSPPTLIEQQFSLVENSQNGTIVGIVEADDADPGDILHFSIGGNSSDAFSIDTSTGQIAVADAPQLDFETTPTFTFEVTVDDGDHTATAQVTVSLVNQASIAGTVFMDADQSGTYDADEVGLDGVTIELLDGSGVPVVDALGSPVRTITSLGGFYLFDDLNPSVYRVHEVQPSGLADGSEQLGSLGGSIVANDTMELTLDRENAADYVFSELGQQVESGDTAEIGFWQNKHGQELIIQGGTTLANWLTNSFGNIFGNQFVGATGSDVAVFYKEQLFKQTAEKTAGPAKVDAQFMAVTLATYFTSRNLAGGTYAMQYGFNVTEFGIGTKLVNVGSSGAAFGAANNSNRTILQLLQQTNLLTDQPNHITGFTDIYDQNGDGVIDSNEASLRTLANSLYSRINETGK